MIGRRGEIKFFSSCSVDGLEDEINRWFNGLLCSGYSVAFLNFSYQFVGNTYTAAVMYTYADAYHS